jgi:ectoine hydroxylase-related dioxygenase (phytanoyl-CoA dioxygenase family)
MAEPLTASERDEYQKRGFFVRERLLGPSLVGDLREAVEGIHQQITRAALEQDSQAGAVQRVDGLRFQKLLGSTVKWEWREDSPHIRSMEPLHHLDARIDRLIEDARITQPLSDLLGCEIGPFTDKLNFKRPGGSPFPWHQDTPYWAFGCEHVDRLVSLQIYLDDATRENGCLWVIPGSHARGVLPVFSDRGTLGRLYTDLGQVEASGAAADPLAIEAPAGSAVFFSGDIVHGSQTNRTQQSRRALILTYQPAGHPRWDRGESQTS